MRTAKALTAVAFFVELSLPALSEEGPISGPTFNCVGASSPIGIAICQDPSSWAADWAMSSSYYALMWSLRDQDQVRLREGHSEWYKSLPGRCSIGERGAPSWPRAGACIADQYRSRAAYYRRQLSGDAAAEADLPQSSRVAIQKRLISYGLMSGEPDGVFGSGSRQAFRSFKQSRGSQPSDFLTAQERSELLRGRPQVASQENYRPERPPPDYRPRPVDPRQVIPEMLQGMLIGGGWPPRQPPSRRQEQADYRPPDFGDEGPRSYHSNRLQDGAVENGAPQDMSEFTPSNKFAQGRSRPIASPPEKATVPPSEFSDSGSSVVTAPLGGRPRPADTSTKSVEVIGNGDTADSARKDAARLAIQQVAGVFIDNRRRVELNMTDNKVSEIVNEKLISYTNAYVSKFDVLSTDQKGGLYEVRAKISVSVEPLLKTLQENAVPTVPFDTATAAATAQTMGEEKISASEIYLDLISRVSSLVNVGVGQPNVDTSLPSTAEEAWLRVPLTFSVNDELMREWYSKFKMMAQARSGLDFGLESVRRGNECSFPSLASDATMRSDWRESFLSKRPVGDSYGIAACFSSYLTTNGISTECFGRSFVTEHRGFSRECVPDGKCYDFDVAARNINLVIEFFDSNSSIVYGTKANIRQFPALNRENSSAIPLGGSREFINYCVGQPKPFFHVLNERSFNRAAYGDVVVFPIKGAKTYAYYNIRVPNNVISSITEVRARIEKSGGQTGR